MKQLALLALALGACSGDGVTIMMTASSGAPAYGQAPFPTDAVRDGDHLGAIAGLEGLVGKHADVIAAHVAALDGFGLRPVVEFFADGAIDPDTIPSHTSD